MPNGLDPEQGRQNVGPDLDPNCFRTLLAGTSKQGQHYAPILKACLKHYIFLFIGSLKGTATLNESESKLQALDKS